MTEFCEIRKGKGAKVPDPVIAIHKDGAINILTTAYEEMGEPTAVKLYTNDTQLALEPTNRGNRANKNVFLLTVEANGQNLRSALLSTQKPTKMLDLEPGKRYWIKQDDETGYWVVDPSNEYGYVKDE